MDEVTHEQLCTELQRVQAHAATAHADLLARHEHERIAGERVQADALAAAQRTHDDRLLANELKIAKWAHRELAQAMSAWRQTGSREAAREVRGKLATIRQEKLRLVGRDLWLEPGVAMCMTFPSDARPAFANWAGNWTSATDTGLIAPCHRVVVADGVLATMAALVALEERCASIAHTGQRLAPEDAETHWAILASGAPLERQEAARAELAAAAERGKREAYDQHVAHVRAVRQGDAEAQAKAGPTLVRELLNLSSELFGPLKARVLEQRTQP